MFLILQQRRGTAGVELCSASCCAWEERREGRRREGGRKGKKRKREKEKGEKKKERERERETVGAIRGGGQPRALRRSAGRRRARGTRGGGNKEGTLIDSGVVMCGERGNRETGQGLALVSGRLIAGTRFRELRRKKNFGVI